MFDLAEIGIFDLIGNNKDQSLNRCDFKTAIGFCQFSYRFLRCPLFKMICQPNICILSGPQHETSIKQIGKKLVLAVLNLRD